MKMADSCAWRWELVSCVLSYEVAVRDDHHAAVDVGKETVEIEASVPHKHNAEQKGCMLCRITRELS
jgi:hypothetical protein